MGAAGAAAGASHQTPMNDSHCVADAVQNFATSTRREAGTEGM
jgi:hypothetical protein